MGAGGIRHDWYSNRQSCSRRSRHNLNLVVLPIRASSKERARRATKDLHAANNLSSELKFRRFVHRCRYEDASSQVFAHLLFVNTTKSVSNLVEPPNSAARRQFKGIRAGREAGNPLRPLPEQPDLTWSCHSLLHAMPCSIRAQARSLTMGRHAAPLAQRQRDVALEPAVASDRALDKLLLAFEPRCRVPSAGATRFAVLGPHPRRRTFVVVGRSFCCHLEAVQLHMISPDDKRLGARPGHGRSRAGSH